MLESIVTMMIGFAVKLEITIASEKKSDPIHLEFVEKGDAKTKFIPIRKSSRKIERLLLGSVDPSKRFLANTSFIEIIIAASDAEWTRIGRECMKQNGLAIDIGLHSD